MARVQRLVSDLSAKEIPDGTGYKARLVPVDGRKTPIEMDLLDEEAEEFGRNGRKVGRRGRRPAQTTP